MAADGSALLQASLWASLRLRFQAETFRCGTVPAQNGCLLGWLPNIQWRAFSFVGERPNSTNAQNRSYILPYWRIDTCYDPSACCTVYAHCEVDASNAAIQRQNPTQTGKVPLGLYSTQDFLSRYIA